MTIRTQIVIPARLASTRLPEKLLQRVGGKTILQHTYAAASRARLATGVVVAVDDPRLADEVESFGGRWMMTSLDCASGTDRIAEVARAMPEIDLFVNVQGDEPEIEPSAIDLVASALIESADADMATVGTPLRDLEKLNSPACVKIVLAVDQAPVQTSAVEQASAVEPASALEPASAVEPGRAGQGRAGQGRAGQGRAIYFSRAIVPHCRDGINEQVLRAEPPVYWHHLGLYAYRREFLAWFAQQPPSPLEQWERLEQLRAIEAGKRIVVARIEHATPGIDTEADLQAFTARYENQSTT
jgi:3-deoxy-manno-octulosonate cytidylyltransferase (CMP-KDO synthetase)